MNLALRFDYQTDYANSATVDAHPFFGQATLAGTYNDGGPFSGRYDGTCTGATFAQLPTMTFPGAEAGVSWKDWSPRLGLTYDVTGDGRNVAKFNYARYVGQLGTGNMSSTYNQDPTNIEWLNGGQYAEESTSSGIGNVFVNAKWIFRLSGAYMLPWQQISVSAFYNARSGYPFYRYVTSPNRPFGGGTAEVRFETWGDERLPNFQTMDFRVDKAITFYGRVRVLASMDVFNLFNGNTALSIRGAQNATNANQISSLLAPRVIRFGFRATW